MLVSLGNFVRKQSDMHEFWDQILFHNSIREWAISISIIAGLIFILVLFRWIVIRKLKAISAKTKTSIDDFIIVVLQSSGMPLLYLLSFYVGLRYLDFPGKIHSVLHVAMLIFATFYVIRIVSSFISYLFRQALARQTHNQQREKQSKGILLIIQIIIWLAGLLFLVDNLGYNITTLIAGLGIGGIAIALAAQTILGDLFSYLVIFFDKPFEIGDFIIIDDKMGSVEYIGIKTTRIRTLGGEQLICSNTDLTNSRVHNYKRMNERRVVFSFGIVYSTPSALIKQIPNSVQHIITSQEGTRFDRCHFKSFGDFSLNFETVYYILSADYNTFMDKQQEINLSVFEYFEQKQIDFAFPTQTLYINKSNWPTSSPVQSS